MKKNYIYPATEFVALHNGAPLLQDPVISILTGSSAPVVDEEDNVE